MRAGRLTWHAADSAVYEAEKSLSEHGEKLSDEIKQDVRSKVSDVRDAMTGDDAARIRAGLEALGAAVSQIGQAIYEEGSTDADAPNDGAGPEGGDETEGGEQPADGEGEDTVEGEYREV